MGNQRDLLTPSRSRTDVAATIWRQLGGNRFTAMTGAKLVGTPNSLLIGLPGRGIKRVAIKLEANDTYTVETFKGLADIRVSTISDVYAEDLQRVFTRLTGLEVKL